MRLVYFVMFGLPLLFSGALAAHDGDDHKAMKPLVGLDQIVVHETTTDVVELVLKHPVFELGKAIPCRVFLSTTDENKPIVNALVEFEFAALNGLQIKFAPEKDHPGVYTGHLLFTKAGTFDATVSVSGAKVSDLLILSGIEVKAALTVATSPWIVYLYFGAALALLVIGALFVIILVRRRKYG